MDSTARRVANTDVSSPALAKGAISGVGNAVIGLATMGPGLTVALFTGFVVLEVGDLTPGFFLLGVIPVLMVAVGYSELNKLDPNCATSFAWGRRAFGGQIGWLTGWAFIMGNVLAVVNIASFAGTYVFLTFDWTSAAESKYAVLAVGVAGILATAALAYRGIRAAVHVQTAALLIEFALLTAFAIIALIKVFSGSAPNGSVHPAVTWFNPFQASGSALAAGLVIAVSVYVGWEAAFNENEETQDGARAPGIGAIVNLVVFAVFVVLCIVAIQAYAGTSFIEKNPEAFFGILGESIFGSPLYHLLDFMIVTSSVGILITLPLATSRLMYGMARDGYLPETFGKIHTRFHTPSAGTVIMASVCVLLLIVLTLASESILADSLASFGILVGTYFVVTGLACVWIFRDTLFQSVRYAIMRGVLPLVGSTVIGYVTIKNLIDLADPANSETGTSWFGLGPPLVIGVGIMLTGLVLMLGFWISRPAVFRRTR